MEDIKIYDKNAKKHNDRQLKAIAKSIKEFGWRQSIVIDKNNEIIVGNGRWMAYKKFKEEMQLIEPRIERADDLSDEQVKGYRLADNKLNESAWDMELVIDELKELSEEMIKITGFDVNLVMDIEEDNFNVDEELNKIKEIKTKNGDIYQLGKHRIICGDSTKQEIYEKLMENEKARLVFTDPPYNIDYKSPAGLTYNSEKYGGIKGINFNDKKEKEECLKFYFDTLANLFNFSTEDCSIYWWFHNKMISINYKAFVGAGWHFSQIIIWLKNSIKLTRGRDYNYCYESCLMGWKKGNKHYYNNKLNNLADAFNLDYQDFQEQLDVWYEHRDLTAQYLHPTQKPIRLAERALKRSSEAGDVVLDAFAGSGSTLMACEQMNRKCYTIELDPKFVDVVIKRYIKFTGNNQIIKNGEALLWEEDL